jgi:hypothetical protein
MCPGECVEIARIASLVETNRLNVSSFVKMITASNDGAGQGGASWDPVQYCPFAGKVKYFWIQSEPNQGGRRLHSDAETRILG